jgi:hypothetical protein
MHAHTYARTYIITHTRTHARTGNGLFTADDSDPEWGIAHRILIKPFSRQGMISFVPLMNEQVGARVPSSFVHSNTPAVSADH